MTTRTELTASTRRHPFIRLLATFMILIAALASGAVIAAPAHAAYPTTYFELNGPERVGADGKFTWFNRSVGVRGDLGGGPSYCSAVVFNGYDQNGRRVARKVIPADNDYTCARYPLDFTLNASSVPGGIRKIQVDLWQIHIMGHQPLIADTGRFGRP